MEIKTSTKIELTDKDIQEIIAEYLCNKGYGSVVTGNVIFDIKTGYRNDGTPGGWPYEYLSGCTVTL